MTQAVSFNLCLNVLAIALPCDTCFNLIFVLYFEEILDC